MCSLLVSLNFELGWFSVSGLILDSIGVVLLAFGVLSNRPTGIIDCGSVAEPVAPLPEELRGYHLAWAGVTIILVGFGFQMLGAWPCA